MKAVSIRCGWTTVDTARWKDEANLLEAWNERTRILASFVAPGRRVLEFGAGTRALEGFLPKGCCYIPSDVVSRGPDTLVCDLNRRPLPVFPSVDFVVFGGVLEYLRDPQAVLEAARDSAPRILVGYAPYSGGGAKEIASRRAHGWVCDLSAEDLFDMFERLGYSAETKLWHRNSIVGDFHARS